MSSALHFKSINYTGQGSGPRLIVTGAVHGNETCGTKGIHRVMAELDSGALSIVAGSVTFVPITNPLAYAKGVRSGDRNLNRNLFPNDNPQDFEDRIANWLCPLLGQHDVLLDLHSFNADSQPFVMVGPRNNDGPLQAVSSTKTRNARWRAAWACAASSMAGCIRMAPGVQRRLGSSDQVGMVLRYGVGTTEYMRSTGGYALTLECGQHADPAAPDVAYRAIMNTLAFLGLHRRAAAGSRSPTPTWKR